LLQIGLTPPPISVFLDPALILYEIARIIGLAGRA